MIEREEKLISDTQEIIFTARLSGNDLAQFGREVAANTLKSWAFRRRTIRNSYRQSIIKLILYTQNCI